MAGSVFLVLALALGAFWIWSGARKLYFPPTSADIRWLGSPDWLAGPIVRSLPLVEVALGILLIARFHVREAAVASALLLGLFGTLKTAAMLRASLSGRAIEGGCGCFGRRPPTPSRRRSPKEASDGGDVRAPRDIAITFALALVSVAIAAQYGAERCRCDGAFFPKLAAPTVETIPSHNTNLKSVLTLKSTSRPFLRRD